MNSHYETGWVLIITLVFLSIASFLTTHMAKESILQKTIGKSIEDSLKKTLNEESNLHDLEQSLGNFTSSKIKPLNFLPDHLEFACQSGMQIFQISQTTVEANYKLRTAEENMPNFVGNCILSEKTPIVRKLNPRSELTEDFAFLDVMPVANPKIKYLGDAAVGYERFKEKYQHRKPCIYALADLGDKPGILYQFDAINGDELAYLSLPISIEKGYIHSQDVYFKGNWHSLLVIVGNNIENKSIILILDITEGFDPSKIIHMYHSIDLDGLYNIIKPKFIRLKSGEWCLVFAGQLSEEGMLYLLSMENALHSFKYRTRSGLTDVSAIDTDSNGFVERIYGLDVLGNLHGFIINEEKEAFLIRTETTCLTAPWVIKNRDGLGLWLLFFGKNDRNEEGLFAVQDSIESRSHDRKSKRLVSGIFKTLIIQSNHLLLIPNDAKHPFLVLEFPLKEDAVKVKEIVFEPIHVHGSITTIAFAQLLRSPKEGDISAKDILLTFSEDCQCNIFSTNLSKDGRIMWRQIQTDRNSN